MTIASKGSRSGSRAMDSKIRVVIICLLDKIVIILQELFDFQLTSAPFASWYSFESIDGRKNIKKKVVITRPIENNTEVTSASV